MKPKTKKLVSEVGRFLAIASAVCALNLGDNFAAGQSPCGPGELLLFDDGSLINPYVNPKDQLVGQFTQKEVLVTRQTLGQMVQSGYMKPDAVRPETISMGNVKQGQQFNPQTGARGPAVGAQGPAFDASKVSNLGGAGKVGAGNVAKGANLAGNVGVGNVGATPDLSNVNTANLANVDTGNVNKNLNVNTTNVDAPGTGGSNLNINTQNINLGGKENLGANLGTDVNIGDTGKNLQGGGPQFATKQQRAAPSQSKKAAGPQLSRNVGIKGGGGGFDCLPIGVIKDLGLGGKFGGKIDLGGGPRPPGSSHRPGDIVVTDTHDDSQPPAQASPGTSTLSPSGGDSKAAVGSSGGTVSEGSGIGFQGMSSEGGLGCYVKCYKGCCKGGAGDCEKKCVMECGLSEPQKGVPCN